MELRPSLPALKTIPVTVISLSNFQLNYWMWKLWGNVPREIFRLWFWSYNFGKVLVWNLFLDRKQEILTEIMQATLQPKTLYLRLARKLFVNVSRLCFWFRSMCPFCLGSKTSRKGPARKKYGNNFGELRCCPKFWILLFLGSGRGENMLENCRKVGEIVETVGNFPPLFVPHVRIWITLAVKAKYMWNSDVPHDQFCGMEWHLPLTGTQNAFICTTHQLFCFWRVVLLWWFVIGGPPNYNPRPLRVCPPPSCLPKPIEAANLDFHPGVLGWVLLNEKLSLFKHRCRSNAIWHPSFQIWNAFAQGVEWFTSFQENCDKLRKISEILSLEFFLILCWTLIFLTFSGRVCVCVLFSDCNEPNYNAGLILRVQVWVFFFSGGQSGAGKRCDVPTTVHWRLSVRLHVHSGEGQRAAACCAAGSTEQWRHLIVVPLGPFRCLS